MPSPPSRMSAPPPPFSVSSPPPPVNQSLPPPPLRVSADGVPGIGFHGKTTATEPTSGSFVIILAICFSIRAGGPAPAHPHEGRPQQRCRAFSGLSSTPVVGRLERRFSGLLPGEQMRGGEAGCHSS